MATGVPKKQRKKSAELLPEDGDTGSWPLSVLAITAMPSAPAPVCRWQMALASPLRSISPGSRSLSITM